ncbi:condensation domain-containing protein [Streptomyces sp. SBT349]|uniref:condensation domain-containing protein n=1 Tax=Streptomyces sp. SBT349 TaxID=1580539 RepID=UPI00066D640D|nr:condensation domain-containing protein [Streptomyces sp. SBT349]
MDDTRTSRPEPAGAAGTALHELAWGQRAIYDHLRCNGYAMTGALVRSLWHVPEPTGAERVRAVLDVLVSRHASLRTVYVDASGAPAGPSVPTRRVRQRVEPPRPTPTSVVRCRREEVDARAEQLMARWERDYVFDPGEPSAMEAALFETDAGVVAVAVGISHMAVDGVGLATLEQEFRHCLRLAGAGRPPGTGLPPVRQPRELLTEEAGEAALRANEATKRYLATVLRETPRAFLTTGRPRSDLEGSHVTAMSWTLHERIGRLAKAVRTPGQTVLLTLVMALVAARAGENRVLFRALSARRHWFRGESYVAPQTIAALVHLEIPAAGTVLDLLKRGRTSTMAGFAQADYDPCALVDLQRERAEAMGAVTDGFCMYNCATPPAVTAGFGGEGGRRRPTEIVVNERAGINMDMQFAFACAWEAAPGAIGVDLRHNDRLVGADAATFLRRLERFAECAAGDPTATVDRVLRTAGSVES